MARAKSIPKSLHGRIVLRWLNGQPIKSIVNWIHQGNASRTEPVITSRSSINRLIAKYANADDLASAPDIVKRARLLAPQALGEFDAALAQLDTWLDAPDDAPRVSAIQLRQNTLRYQTAIRWLKIGGVHANRRLPADERANQEFLELLQSPEKLAGFARRLVEQNEEEDSTKSVRLDCENSGKSSRSKSNSPALIQHVRPFQYGATRASVEKGASVTVWRAVVPALEAGISQAAPL